MRTFKEHCEYMSQFDFVRLVGNGPTGILWVDANGNVKEADSGYSDSENIGKPEVGKKIRFNGRTYTISSVEKGGEQCGS